MDTRNVAINLTHHLRGDFCTTRPAYRQGRKLTSMKVYTVNKESQHLLVYNVPAINLDSDLLEVCQRYGLVTACSRVPSQEVEEFTVVYHVRFEKVYHARLAKRKMDNLSFYGGLLHVCYAPELETVEETRDKLSTRRKEVAFHLKKIEFPKQFRPQSKRGVKRKPSDIEFVEKKFLANDLRNLSSSQDRTSQDYFTVPHTTGKLAPVDVEPFKKLIPTKVSRIVFHDKTTKTNKL